MAFFSVNNVKVSGIAAAVPKNSISNWDYNLLSNNEKKLLIKTTGVENRRVVDNGVTTSDLCYEAAEQLIKELKWAKEEIQVVIFLSQSRDYYLPATSIILQDRLRLPKSCMAFDIGLGCSGFVYGLSVISSIMSATCLSKGLLMMGDISSLTCSKEDKSTYPLFGDAGTATAIEFDSNSKKMNFNLNSDGSGHKAIMIPAGGVRNGVNATSFDMKEIANGIKRCDLNLALNGLDVFNFSVKELPKSINEYFEYFKTTKDSYDYFLMHQANKLMNETIRKKLKIEEGKVPYSLQSFGNTSSASIPLTIVTELKNQVKTESLNLLMAGFGVGLSWGISSLTLNKIVCPDLIEI
jgi:3-oxoacyl-[acyl-carrier-protein] synthase-3